MIRQKLIELFRYNDWAHQRILDAIGKLDDQQESLRLFSHLINAQDIWMQRVQKANTNEKVNWMEAEYSLDQCRDEWRRSLNAWTELLEKLPDSDLAKEIKYAASDGGSFVSTIEEIATQLCLHNVHHRAQIARIIRQQGHVPPTTDNIFMTRRKIS